MAKGNKLYLEVSMEEGDPLRATPDERLMIARIQSMTLTDGKLRVGDKVLKITKIKVRDRNYFYQLLCYAPPFASLNIVRLERDSNPPSDAISEQAIQPERERIVVMDIDVLKGRRLGLTESYASNRVLVSKIESGLLSEGKLFVGDHIVNVEDRRATDKDVARGMLVSSIKKQGFFTCVIGRPTSDDAKAQVVRELSIKKEGPPSVQLIRMSVRSPKLSELK